MFEFVVERRVIVGYEIRRYDVPVQPTRATLLSAVTRTTAEHTARFTMSLEITGYQTLHYTARGGVNFDTKNAVFLFDSSAVEPGAPPIDTRIVGDKVYVLDRAQWFSGTLAGLQQASQDGIPQSQANPSGILGNLSTVSTKIEEVGPDPVDGTPATHYSATVTKGEVTMPVDVWVDELGRTLRIRMEIPVGAALTPAARSVSLLPESAGIKIDVKFTDFGTKVDAEAPPGITPKPLSQLIGQ